MYSEESNRGEEAIIHCQGQAGLIATGEVERPEFIDIRQVQAECTDKVISGSECYEKFRSLGIIYGNGHKGIESIYIGEEKLLAKITLPKSVGEDAYILHPSVVDSAIQATIAFSTDKRTKEDTESKDLSLPFALEELEIITPCTENMWAVVRKNASMKSDDHMKKLDIDLIDENGKISVRMKALSFRNFESNSKGKENIGAIMFRPVWKQSNEIEV
ncbi:polyketide synthase dehydratase domain-containing protein [Bacillus atrophaeus]|uniref:polyketide synthase dehydratase domain-containing protein n=1 Tax=Bacillus atrophaeus TaxID=1452 RepID=UPI004037D4FD